MMSAAAMAFPISSRLAGRLMAHRPTTASMLSSSRRSEAAQRASRSRTSSTSDGSRLAGRHPSHGLAPTGATSGRACSSPSKADLACVHCFWSKPSGRDMLTAGIGRPAASKWRLTPSPAQYRSNGERMRFPHGSRSSLAYPFSSDLRLSSRSNSSSRRTAPGAAISRVRRSSSSTSLLFDLWLCSCRQKSPIPAWSSRAFTTSRAAIFSLTKRTLRPAARDSAMTLAMVCDLPVPGGPSTTRLRPDLTSSMAAICEGSASTI